MTTTSQAAAFGQYLARYGFAPDPGNAAWLDRDTGQQIIRVIHEPARQPGCTAWTRAAAACTRPDSAQVPRTP